MAGTVIWVLEVTNLWLIYDQCGECFYRVVGACVFEGSF
jgi:hypothetical protein